MINKYNFKISVVIGTLLPSWEVADTAVSSQEWFFLLDSGFFILNNCVVFKLCMSLQYEIEAFAISLSVPTPNR